MNHQFSSVQSLSCIWLFVTPWIAARQASLSITNSWNSLKLMSIESVMPSSHLILCCPLFLLPSIPPSMSLFQWVNSSHEVAKVLEFQLQIHSFQRNPRADLQNGLVGSPCSPRYKESFPTPRLKSINYSVLRFLYNSTLTSIHDYWKNHIALTRRTFVDKVMSLLFNMLSRLVINIKVWGISKFYDLGVNILQNDSHLSSCTSSCLPQIIWGNVSSFSLDSPF